MRPAAVWCACVALIACAAPKARAVDVIPDSLHAGAPADTARPGAPADTALRSYLNSLRDSTESYFGKTVAPVDTAGLDSALSYGLEHPEARQLPRKLRPEFAPWLGFNRVDGPVYGGWAGIGRRRSYGFVSGRAGYAVGADTWLGAGEYEKRARWGETAFLFNTEVGRLTASMDRERSDLRFAMVRAFISGNDTRRYLRNDGLRASLEAEHSWWRGLLTYRDMLESPLPVTARWDLIGSSLAVDDNLAATPGHVHELGYRLGVRTPLQPLTVEAEYATSSEKIGSDFEYRRTRLGVAGDFGLGRSFALVPQVTYGRLSGAMVPQAALYLGGSHSLRSLEGGALGGTGLALAKIELHELPDLLEVLRIPHPALLPLQVSAFAATGAVWGRDPYGGPTRPGVDWPNTEEFRHEAGVSLMYRPGIPDPSAFMQLSWAWPIGPHAPGPRFTVSYTRGLDLVHPVGGDNEP
jgi:hypothetical protein